MGGGLTKHVKPNIQPEQNDKQNAVSVSQPLHQKPASAISDVIPHHNMQPPHPIENDIIHEASNTITCTNIQNEALKNDEDDRLDEKSSIDDTDDEFAEKSAEMFASTAMSLGMDNDELLFNLMYFGGGGDAAPVNFDAMVNSALEETIALHSDNNTPYKLKPATDSDLAHLESTTLKEALPVGEDDCAVCRDTLVIGDEYIRLHNCHHCFHTDCLLRWVNLQAWCPTCRQPIGDAEDSHVKASLASQFETIAENLAEESSDQGFAQPTEEVSVNRSLDRKSSRITVDCSQEDRPLSIRSMIPSQQVYTNNSFKSDKILTQESDSHRTRRGSDLSPRGVNTNSQADGSIRSKAISSIAVSLSQEGISSAIQSHIDDYLSRK